MQVQGFYNAMVATAVVIEASGRVQMNEDFKPGEWHESVALLA